MRMSLVCHGSLPASLAIVEYRLSGDFHRHKASQSTARIVSAASHSKTNLAASMRKRAIPGRWLAAAFAERG